MASRYRRASSTAVAPLKDTMADRRPPSKASVAPRSIKDTAALHNSSRVTAALRNSSRVTAAHLLSKAYVAASAF